MKKFEGVANTIFVSLVARIMHFRINEWLD